MFTQFDAYRPYALALLRIMAGLLYFAHGTQKLFDFPVPGPGTLGSLALVSALLEVVGGAMIVLGLFTRPVAFVLSGHMAAAYFMAHAPQNLWPVANGGDAAILFSFVFLMLVTTGPGAWAIDNNMRETA
ncbi:DoxX family protein [Falsigemmobacter faecalis]|uniref:DoxX family protein n=1 Tax=Falsigemmobacter faecalis TaxID=2488730 RepID=A0A3P3D413_9RHOB|nr:DoxX family protein [Falsigemmobacter faecalis]RRH68841.1 DoxX family protein [Falsigemmobacter faecalis]